MTAEEDPRIEAARMSDIQSCEWCGGNARTDHEEGCAEWFEWGHNDNCVPDCEADHQGES